MLYGRQKGFSWRQLFHMALNGTKTINTLLVTLLLIGIMTAFWRASGTISFIVCYASKLIRPSIFLLMTFLLNCAMSFLTGTSFGTAATMGVVCATMASALGISPVLTGGSILSGVFFGDRCSPVSTSALLVSTITCTDIYGNIRLMLRSALIPFILTSLIYLILGLKVPEKEAVPDLEALFSREFSMSWPVLIPALVILILSFFRVNVKLSLIASILSAIPICLVVQRIPFSELIRIAIYGFYPHDSAVATMISGGGFVSMLKVVAIVFLSSSYVDILKESGLLDGIKLKIAHLSRASSPFAATLLTSAVSGMIACNQTLAILLTNQLCKGEYQDNVRFANDLEDTAVVVAPLIPWSIAGAVPLATVGAPTTAILASFYLIFLPLYRLMLSIISHQRLSGLKE